MTNTLPAGCKPAKLNLTNAYRTTYTHIVAGDVVRVRQVDGRCTPAGTQATKDSFWVQVVRVDKAGSQVQICVAGDRTLLFTAAHTSITRKERSAEYTARMEQARADRAAAMATTELELESKGVTVDPFPGLDVQASVNAGVLATGFVSPEEAVAVLQTVGQTSPADLAVQLVTIAKDGGVGKPYTTVLDNLDRDIASDPANAGYYRAVQMEVNALKDRAIQVASSAAMRQAADPEPERAVLGEPMCLGDFGAYGSCVAVPGHLGKCMDAHGKRFDGRNRRQPSFQKNEQVTVASGYFAGKTGRFVEQVSPELASVHITGRIHPANVKLSELIPAQRTVLDRADEEYNAASAAVETAFPAVSSPDRTKLLNAEGTVRNLLAEAQEVLEVAYARGGEAAHQAAMARRDTLKEVLGLLV